MSMVLNDKLASAKLCSTPLGSSSVAMDFILVDFIGPFEVTSRGSQYAVTVICMPTNYLFVYLWTLIDICLFHMDDMLTHDSNEEDHLKH